MVFNKFTHLARPSLSKTLTHGYAQSVVAATQSSTQLPLAKHNKSKAGRPNPGHQQLSFSTHNAAASTSSHASRLGGENSHLHDTGLRTYFEAWQKLHRTGTESKEWKQFQFPKAIEASPPSSSNAQQSGDDSLIALQTEPAADRGNLGRAMSSSAVHDIKKAEEHGEAAAIEKVNEAVALVIQDIKGKTEDGNITKASSLEPVSPAHGQSKYTSTQDQGVPASGEPADKLQSAPAETVQTDKSSPLAAEVPSEVQQVLDLFNAREYHAIPPAFEAALSRGITPAAEAYDALLASALHLSLARNQLIPKALGIYADMVRRNVVPSSSFYSQLLQILSRQAMYAASVQESLEQTGYRFRHPSSSQSSLLPSKATDYRLASEDDSLSNALTIFATHLKAGSGMSLPAETYQLLIHACAQEQNVDGMLRVYEHMEATNVKPLSTIFPAMIEAFSRSGDLESATECYNEYRSLAIADDAGSFVIIGRSDVDVYSALIRGFAMCGKLQGSKHFFEKIIASFSTTSEDRISQLKAAEGKIAVAGLLEGFIGSKSFTAAWEMISTGKVPEESVTAALSSLSIKAADESAAQIACLAYEQLEASKSLSPAVTTALLAMHTRNGDWEAASSHFQTLNSYTSPTVSFLEPTVFYATALMHQGQVDTALSNAHEIFTKLRASQGPDSTDVTERIDEAIQILATETARMENQSATANVKLLNIMLENGGLIQPIAEQALSVLGPEAVASLTWADILVSLRVQAAVVANMSSTPNGAHGARLDHLIELATKDSGVLDSKTMHLVGNAVKNLAPKQADIVEKWNAYTRSLDKPQEMASTSLTSPLVQPSQMSMDESYDPSASSTDYRGSSIIIDELDNHRNARGLKEALNRFRNIRRAGRHPRYIVYAKLITAAAKEGRVNLIHDILGMARTDVPCLPGLPMVRHGWSAILDAMVGACLSLGKRALADQYHREMSEIGIAPSANTYGLYITTLKASTKTFDEASEAVKIFQRALSEGVVPTSFLYNALIGKLGKARRIDDCLRYFQEMRAAGVRPTSVTYGTVVNALCRVSDEKFAEELFDEMESMPNYKPRPAPYNSLMQYFLTTKRDSQKVLSYFERMRAMRIEPTMHTYKLLIDTYATLEPINLSAAESILEDIRAQGLAPEAVHYASLIHAKGCVLHDMTGARKTFEEAITCKEFPPQASLYQALFESMVANHRVVDTEALLDMMSSQGVEMTPYIANTLIHGWAMEDSIAKSKAIYDAVGIEKREPSTYEAMTRAYLTAEDHRGALGTIHEMLSRGYPSAVSGKIVELVGHGANRAGSGSWPSVIA